MLELAELVMFLRDWQDLMRASAWACIPSGQPLYSGLLQAASLAQVVFYESACPDLLPAVVCLNQDQSTPSPALHPGTLAPRGVWGMSSFSCDWLHVQEIVYQPQGQPAADSQPLGSYALPIPVPLGPDGAKAPAPLPSQPLNAGAQHSAPLHNDALHALAPWDINQHMAQQAGAGEQQDGAADEMQQHSGGMDPEIPQVSHAPPCLQAKSKHGA